MSLQVPPPAPVRRLRIPRATAGGTRSAGDKVMLGLCAIAGIFCAVVLGDVVFQIIHGAHKSISHFGLGFLSNQNWAPNLDVFGAATALYGTAVTSAIALIIATPLALGIALFLALDAPPWLRTIISPLVEMLAAIPSVIVGLWGLIVLGPFLSHHIEGPLHSVLGFLPIFGERQLVGTSIFTAGIVLAIMILPIIASLSRDLFMTVPQELQDGAAALGATRWEIIRGVVFPSTFSGVAATIVLALGRAIGEAIAVTQVIGFGSGIHASIFDNGQSLSSRIANDFQDIVSPLHQESIFYLALILLVFAIITNLLASFISQRFGRALTA